MNLKDSTIDKDNPIYKKQNNCIVDKRNNYKVIEFATEDKNYKRRTEFAKKLYETMKLFLKANKECSVLDFDTTCIDYLKQNSKPQRLLTKDKFKELSKGQQIVYRGIPKQEYINDFKSGIMFFSSNMVNEKGNGIYVTPEFEQAEFWQWFYDSRYWDKFIKYIEDNRIAKKDEKSLKEAKVLNNDYLDECKDLTFKSHPDDFKDTVAFNGGTLPPDMLQKANIYQNKSDMLMHNSDLLVKLLGYDAIFSSQNQLEIDNNRTLGSEYLVVNPEILNVLID